MSLASAPPGVVTRLWSRVRALGQRVSSLAAPIGRRVRKAVSAVTTVGWLVAGGALLCWVVSRLFGWQEFTAVALALAAAFIVAALFILGRARYQVTLDMRNERVVVGTPAVGAMKVQHAGGGRLLPVKMELPVGTAVARVAVPSMKAGGVHEEPFVIPTNKRAVIVIGPARSVRGDGLGLLRRVVNWTEPELLYVHPRTVSLQGAAPGFIRDLEGQPTRELSNSDVSFHALRGYVPGDDRRYIHWKTSARTGTLMVRQFEETRRSHLVVTLSTHLDDYANEEEFEIAVSAGASLAVQSFRDERRVSVFSGTDTMHTGTVRRLMDDLAGIDVDEVGKDVVAAAQYAAGQVPEASVAIVLCGSIPTPQQIRSAAMAFPLGIRVIVVRVVLGVKISIRKIGQVPVLTVGSLDDLARGLRAVKA